LDNYQKNTSNMQEGAITLLDVLGWKGIWQRKSDALQALMDLIETAQKTSNTVVGEEAIFSGLVPTVESISDTIAITTFGPSDITLAFHAGLSGRLVGDSLLREIPVRGATSYGHLVKKGNIMVGPAVDEVAAWYECSDMIGVFQTPSALLSNISTKYRTFYIDYNVPIKQYGKMQTRCSNWLSRWKVQELSIIDLKDTFKKMGPITPSIYSKFKNTIDFYEEAYKQKGYSYDKGIEDKK